MFTKNKVVLKLKDDTDGELCYSANYRGEDATAFAMSIGFATQLAKQAKIPLKELQRMVKGIYEEMEEENNGND